MVWIGLQQLEKLEYRALPKNENFQVKRRELRPRRVEAHNVTEDKKKQCGVICDDGSTCHEEINGEEIFCEAHDNHRKRLTKMYHMQETNKSFNVNKLSAVT